MKIDVEILYKQPNKIQLRVGKKKAELINDVKKTILASEIYNVFDYKLGNKYELKKLSQFQNISDDYQSYLNEIYILIDSIIKDFQ